MAYEFNPEDVMRFADTMAGPHRTKGEELFFTYCPYCMGGAHKDKDTFSVNLKTGTFNCFRSGCGKHGHFVELARDFQFPLDFGGVRKYKALPQQEVKTTDYAVEYLKSRGIPEEVTKEYKITTLRDNKKVLVFPFYDDTRTLVFAKYRNTQYSGAGSKEWCEKDTRPILFGMAQCDGFDRLVITEGQIDSLSLAACGIKNPVSVPTGALGFTWLVNCWDWIVKFKEIVVFGDFERGKMTLIDELRKRLPNKIKAVREQDYLGEKDANAVLTKYGRQAVVTAVENAMVPPLKNVKELADVKSVDINTLPKIKTNITEIDKLIGGLVFGQVTLLSGKRGEGKSTFLSQLIVEAMEQDYPVFIYSGELTDYHFKRWLDYQAAGPKHLLAGKNEYGDTVYSLPEPVLDKLSQWYRGRAYLYDNNYLEDGDEMGGLLETIAGSIRQYGIKLVCIDNLMTALDVGMREDLYRGQSKFVKQLKRLAVRYDVAVVLVAHPRKSKDRFDNDDVSGSGDITNAVDVVMSYSRNNQEEDDCDGKLAVTKNRLTGRLTGNYDIRLFYSQSTKRITSLSSRDRVYGWERDYDRFAGEFDTLPF